MDKHKIKETVTIKIHNLPVECYITGDKVKYIGRNIEHLFRTKPTNVILSELSDGINAYSIDVVVENLKPSIAKELVKYGLEKMIDNQNPNNYLGFKEPEMSEFDRNIKKALNFNPNK